MEQCRCKKRWSEIWLHAQHRVTAGRRFFRIADGQKWRVWAHDWDSEHANTALHRFGDSSPDGGDNFGKIAREYPCKAGEARWKQNLRRLLQKRCKSGKKYGNLLKNFSSGYWWWQLRWTLPVTLSESAVIPYWIFLISVSKLYHTRLYL